MVEAMSRLQIVQETGISAANLDQVLAAKGAGAKKGKQPQAKISP